jgi:thiamine biosynthesis lipoprotein
MGTVLEITLVVRDARSGRSLLEQAFARAAELDRKLSRHDRSSEVSALNDAAGGEPIQLSPAVARALRASRRYWELTGGAFDVTVGPLVALWTRAAREARLPDADALAEARARVGADALTVTDDGRGRLARSGMALDLGGIGKGFALDELRGDLEGRVEGALLDFGRSSMLALGTPDDGDAWRILVGGGAGEPRGVVEISDRALSVSSSLGQHSVIEGNSYGHVIDPRTGRALSEGRFAVVLAPTATEAEVWSTALLVLDAGEGLRRIGGRTDVEASAYGEGGILLRTAGFDPLRLPSPLPGGAPAPSR